MGAAGAAIRSSSRVRSRRAARAGQGEAQVRHGLLQGAQFGGRLAAALEVRLKRRDGRIQRAAV